MPLKQVSTIWWLFSPYWFHTCSVSPPSWAKAWNHSLNSSVSIVPSLSRVKFTFQIRYGRFDTSSATSVSVSSIGMVALP